MQINLLSLLFVAAASFGCNNSSSPETTPETPASQPITSNTTPQQTSTTNCTDPSTGAQIVCPTSSQSAPVSTGDSVLDALYKKMIADLASCQNLRVYITKRCETAFQKVADTPAQASVFAAFAAVGVSEATIKPVYDGIVGRGFVADQHVTFNGQPVVTFMKRLDPGQVITGLCEIGPAAAGAPQTSVTLGQCFLAPEAVAAQVGAYFPKK